MVPTTLTEAPKEEKKKVEAEKDFRNVVERLQRLLREKGPMTRKKIGTYAGTSGIFGVGDHKLRGIIGRAVEEEYLVEEPVTGKDYTELHPPSDEG